MPFLTLNYLRLLIKYHTLADFKNREKCQNPEIMKLENNQNYLDD
jgi:hypothetical protein